MIRPLRTLPLAALLAVAAILPASAQTLKPGLWETSSTVSSSDPQTQAALSQMQKHLAGMTPAQRQAMQQMMRHNGVQVDLGANGALRTRMCMTRAMIERNEFPVQQGQCTQQATQVSPRHVKVTFNCTKPAASGVGDVFVDDDTHYHGRVTVNAANGQNAQADVTGAWVAAECAGAGTPASATK